MRIAIAIVIAGALIACALLFVNRWQISGTNELIWRLDRWSGRIAACNLEACREIPR